MNQGKSRLVGLVLVTIVLLMQGSAAAQGTSVFVTYGTMYEMDEVTIVNEGYLITVTNLTKNLSSNVLLGQNDGTGQYSVVWIDLEGGLVAEAGDELRVSANKEGEATIDREHTITSDDINSNRVMMDLIRGLISTQPSTWGAIKSLMNG